MSTRDRTTLCVTRRATRTALALVVALTVTTAASASGQVLGETAGDPSQRPQATPLREGQWLAVGFGGGFDQISCDICSGDPKAGFAGYVRFGGTLDSRLLIGAELIGWTRGDEGIRQYLGSVGAVLLWYPRPAGSFYLKGGLGAVGYRAAEAGDALTALTLGGQVGIGYEHRLGKALSLAPFANLLLAPSANLSFNGDAATGGATLALLQGGLGITWH